MVLKALSIVCVVVGAAFGQQASSSGNDHVQDQQSSCEVIGKAVSSGGSELRKACEFVESLRNNLPNVVCEQSTWRYGVQGGNAVLLDTITATVTHDRNGEQYSEIKINGRPMSAEMSHLPGHWSVGEFGDDLLAIFEPRSFAQFRFVKESSFASAPAILYDFDVIREKNTSWAIQAYGSTTYPGLRGRFWLKKNSAEILQIEIRAVDFPRRFAIQQFTKNVEYENTLLGDGTNFVLPRESESTICVGTNCTRNTIKFQNCRKFAAKSQILPGVAY